MNRSLLTLLGVAIVCTACGGSPTTPSNTAATYTPAQDPATATALTYTSDVQPILSADCTVCHNASRKDGGYDFTSYAGVMRAVTAGSAQSPLVRQTQPGGPMYANFRGAASAKAETIRRWVVDFKAVQ
jgi:hypothetical protein